MNQKQLIEKKNDLITRAEETLNKAKTEERELTPDEMAELAEIKDNVKKIKDMLEMSDFFSGENNIKEKLLSKAPLDGTKLSRNASKAELEFRAKQYDDFNVKIGTLDDNIKAVENIENQINSYAQVLSDLNEMTDKVEENLRRIQKESNVVDSISNKLLKQQQTVETIDKRIPQVSENFSKYNAEQLKAIGATLLDEYKALYNKNKSLIGWIKIDGTKIDYPVMQTVNNYDLFDGNCINDCRGGKKAIENCIACSKTNSTYCAQCKENIPFSEKFIYRN